MIIRTYTPAGDKGGKNKHLNTLKSSNKCLVSKKVAPATKDVALNTKNRNATRDNHVWSTECEGTGDYWEKLADMGHNGWS